MLQEQIGSMKGQITFKKSDLRLREDINGQQDSVYVKPDNDTSSSHSMATDIQNSIQRNPGESDFTVDTSEYDTANNNNDVTIDVNANNGMDAQKKIQHQMQIPQMRSLGQNGQLKANVHIMDSKKKSKKLKKLEEGIHFTKEELNRFLTEIERSTPNDLPPGDDDIYYPGDVNPDVLDSLQRGDFGDIENIMTFDVFTENLNLNNHRDREKVLLSNLYDKNDKLVGRLNDFHFKYDPDTNEFI